AELAIVVKKRAKNVQPEDAFEYILGYTCFNDVTARDLQRKDIQWTRAKSFDTFCPVGPDIVSNIDPSNLKIEAILNDKIVQSSNTKNMIFKVPEIFSFVSKIMTLEEGDIIATGTPPGVGPMKPGDKIEIRIEKIGSLINFVV
ncbi:MAG: fumarylacetoacetate hydrolase family protein, partial [Endomicrobiia bacterium]